MYGGNGAAGAAGAAPLAALPYTGFSAIWLVLIAVTLFTTGLATVRLARR
jgi:LPXTG-motif cell wall-anchored protein